MAEHEAQENYSVDRQEGGLLVAGPAFDYEDDNDDWVAQPIDDNRVLLVSKDGRDSMAGSDGGFANCSAELFKDFLVGLVQAGWSGVVSVDTGYGIKKLYFTEGSLVFAGSNVIDDRLGEVIYREARISLDELTNSAAQVTKKQKFGQVLLDSGIFSNVDLWDALKLQVMQILRSVFMVETVYFQLDQAGTKAPTEVVFQDGALEIVRGAFSYGCSFRDFLSRLRAESEVVLLVESGDLSGRFQPGSFIGDLLALIHEKPNVQDLLEMSKLMDINTIAALSSLVNRGICAIRPDIDSERKKSPVLQPLKTKVDAYGYVLQSVKAAFADSDKKFPMADFHLFVDHLNPTGFRSLYVDREAQISKDCINGLFSQCVANAERVQYFTLRIEGMIQFLLQLSGDNLEWSVAKNIRSEYRSISG